MFWNFKPVRYFVENGSGVQGVYMMMNLSVILMYSSWNGVSQLYKLVNRELNDIRYVKG